MKIFHVDGGAFPNPPTYIFKDAYFTIVDEQGKLVHFAKNIGNFWSGIAEFLAIKWVVDNIQTRPIKITSDCLSAIKWAKLGGNLTVAKGKRNEAHLPEINLDGVTLVWEHANLADIWNAKNHSPKTITLDDHKKWSNALKNT